MRLVGYVVEVIGLSPDVTEKEIHGFFSCCGRIENLEIFRSKDQLCTAYVTFRGAYAVESAVLLSGARIGNQSVSISPVDTSTAYSVLENDQSASRIHLSKFEDTCSSSGFQMDQSVSSPREASTGVVTSLIGKGKEVISRAKALDESYQVSSTAATKAVQLTDKLGLTSKIISGVEVAKSVNKKYHVSDRTVTVASFTGRTVVATGNAVVSHRYFGRGALWISRVLDRASKVAADLGKTSAQN